MKYVFIAIVAFTGLMIYSVYGLAKSLEPVLQQYVAESQAEVARRAAGKIESVEPLQVGYFEQHKSLVKTTEGSYFVAGLVSYQEGCKVNVSKRLNDQKALCICEGQREQCYWIY